VTPGFAVCTSDNVIVVVVVVDVVVVVVVGAGVSAADKRKG